MKKQHTILACICTATILPLLVAMMFCGCKKDSKETVAVFELQDVNIGGEIRGCDGYLYKIETMYSSYIFYDFRTDGEVRNGEHIIKTKIYNEPLDFHTELDGSSSITYSCTNSEIKIRLSNDVDELHRFYNNYFIVEEGECNMFHGKYQRK